MADAAVSEYKFYTEKERETRLREKPQSKKRTRSRKIQHTHAHARESEKTASGSSTDDDDDDDDDGNALLGGQFSLLHARHKEKEGETPALVYILISAYFLGVLKEGG